ncbi:HAMP domain-containing histidine kinase [Geobacter sp. FeAm09]|uniref:HAMP domain-containing sensor histidine kinase n=1 Tax=Geobacter sp. FeAm09 TaxID=2597769 RepID=UPI0011ECDA61|nr:HAMP domain-containing sensor histidine kinase [Geobacter sp. FeAm09]QEM67763.1 HAMP domain-containing histidine kinase [Geobacter sp. FeAm09]
MMRRLYFKILFHWCVALVVTALLAFALVFLLVKDGHQISVTASVGRTALMARDYVEAAADGAAARHEEPGAVLRRAVQQVSRNTRAKVWISGADGSPLAASFPGEVRAPGGAPGLSGRYGAASVAVEAGQNRLTYATVPLAPGTGGAEQAWLHILTEREPGRFPHGAFAAGLALICAVVAVIAVPLSRHITEPLNRLQGSAVRIAGGDLSARADVRGDDEIGRLGAAFNGMAETVERMVRAGRELTANVSHEMRSPLARIRVAGECLQGALARGDRAEAGALLAGMWEDIDEADRMVGRILQYSKLDLHAPAPATALVQPSVLLNGLMKAMRPLFGTKRITVEQEVEPDLWVNGDEEYLRSALKNILENAARYTPEQGVVRLGLRREGAEVLLEVVNSAPPVAEDDLERLFEPFYRGKGATGEGTGLGLAIARKVVLLHHGEMGVENTPQGFRVWLRLPAAGA